MPRMISRSLDSLASAPLRFRSVLRLVLIVLIALLVSITHVEHRNDAVFKAVLVLYAVGSVVWLFFVMFRVPPAFGSWASTAADVVIVVILCIASGPGTIALYPIFFLLPISVAFLDSPLATAALGCGASFGYLLAWVFYAIGDHKLVDGIPAVVYVQVGCLLWLAVAITSLSFALERRRARVVSLLDVRRRLIAESMRADERHNRELSEQLHDGPLQNLLAARLDVDDLRDNPTPEGFDRLDAALRETVSSLRTTVSVLHPQVLVQVGLSAAIRELAERYEQRWGATVECDIDEVGRFESQALVYRAARELLANAQRHSGAATISVALHRGADDVALSVTDDGVGFDPTILARRVAEGHIGLSSLVVGVEATGGSVEFGKRRGGGSVVTVTVPADLGVGELAQD